MEVISGGCYGPASWAFLRSFGPIKEKEFGNENENNGWICEFENEEYSASFLGMNVTEITFSARVLCK